MNKSDLGCSCCRFPRFLLTLSMITASEQHQFKEKDLFVDYIEKLKSAEPDPYDFERFLIILDQYQDQPQALDSSLNQVIGPIISRIIACIIGR